MVSSLVFSTVDPGAPRAEPPAMAMPTPTAAPVFAGSGLDDALRSALSVALRAEHTMNRLAAVSAYYSALSASAEFRSTAMRAFRQDVKDPVKDQGEAGRKP
ncbi:hypothetical protein ACPOLB_24820 [Rubrivivax sp. RP6-9]|uniref:hypothetical protein n=1 Tax=Rubrivivax sp. RP6-9 TaxID=3415750 RepID=UPI003CC5C795